LLAVIEDETTPALLSRIVEEELDRRGVKLPTDDEA
jgi:hypothetical protein